MGVYKHNNKWYFQFMIRGKRYHEAIPEATSERDAKKYEQAFKTDLLRGRLELVEDIGRVHFSVLVDDYIKYAQTNLKSTDTVIPVAKKFKKMWGRKQSRDITPNLIEEYKSKRNGEIYYQKEVDGVIRTKKISPATVNRELGVLSKIFNIGISNNYVRVNPVEKVSLLKVSNKLERHLSIEEQDRFIKFCNHDYSFMNLSEKELKKVTKRFSKYSYDDIRDIVLISLNTGMRRGEVLNLTWDCVDLNNNILCALDTKNGKSNYVPINSTVKNILQERYKSKGNNKYVFTNPETGGKYKVIQRSFHTICKMANIENFRFHDTRHTFASRAIENNTPVPVLKEILNHSSINTTMRYVHSSFNQKLNAVKNLDNYQQTT